MRTVFTNAALVAAIAFAAPAAAESKDGQTLSARLAGCHANRQTRLDDLRYACNAAEQELRWLRNAAARDSELASGKERGAEWTALHMLRLRGN